MSEATNIISEPDCQESLNEALTHELISASNELKTLIASLTNTKHLELHDSESVTQQTEAVSEKECISNDEVMTSAEEVRCVQSETELSAAGSEPKIEWMESVNFNPRAAKVDYEEHATQLAENEQSISEIFEDSFLLTEDIEVEKLTDQGDCETQDMESKPINQDNSEENTQVMKGVTSSETRLDRVRDSSINLVESIHTDENEDISKSEITIGNDQNPTLVSQSPEEYRFIDWSVQVLAASMQHLRDGNTHNFALSDLDLTSWPPFKKITDRLLLSEMEQQILWLCFACQYSGGLASLCGELSNRFQPSLELAANLLNGGQVLQLRPDSALRYWGLLTLENDTAPQLSPLLLDESIFYYLMGTNSVPVEIQKYLLPIEVPTTLEKNSSETTLQICDYVTKNKYLGSSGSGNMKSEPGHIIRFISESNNASHSAFAESLAYQVAIQLDNSLKRINVDHLPHKADETHDIAVMLQRYCLLTDTLLFIDGYQSDNPAIGYFLNLLTEPLRSNKVALEQNSQCKVPDHKQASSIALPKSCFYIGEIPEDVGSNRVLNVQLPKSSKEAQREEWINTLSQRGWNVNPDVIGQLTTQYQINHRAAQAINNQLALLHGKSEQELDANLLAHVCRLQSRQEVEGYIKVIPPASQGHLTWEDLVLRPQDKNTLMAIRNQMSQRQKVYEQWGLGDKKAYGTGLAVLFSGPSGTGKTHAARVLATQLGLDIYQVDLSTVMDKYIGESEKKLERIFTAAESSGAILLFDEADALFGKRSDIKDSKDRFANAGVSYLLQRMESFNGLSILTSNFKDALDGAFKRRLRFMVNFAMPDTSERIQIWRSCIPGSIPQSKIDFTKLANLPVGGGLINSIATNSLFIAAGRAEGEDQVTMKDILIATQMEYAKSDKVMPKHWVASWLK